MSKKTEQNLAHAFAGESKAAVRNNAFAQKAEQEGYSQIARLFRAVSDAESVHARRYLNLMRGKIGNTEENLETAFQNEIRANVNEYGVLIKDASDEGQKVALTAFTQSRDVEAGHAELYKRAMNDMLMDREEDYYVCQVCGYISEGAAPEKCPICGAVEVKFKLIP
ncbi:MAG: rubrerythrin family protein [Deltaproteobacteria bacterium]|nr:rubrerythrin family protein [Deltaproteobacteria bacterium]